MSIIKRQINKDTVRFHFHMITPSRPVQCSRPDWKQSLGHLWVMVGVVCNSSLLSLRADIDPTLVQQLKYCVHTYINCWPNVGPSTTTALYILSSGANDGPTYAYIPQTKKFLVFSLDVSWLEYIKLTT